MCDRRSAEARAVALGALLAVALSSACSPDVSPACQRARDDYEAVQRNALEPEWLEESEHDSLADARAAAEEGLAEACA